MKRSPTSIPELQASPRRRRSLSEEERALWESVAKQTKPLRKKPRAAKPHTAAPDSEAPIAAKPAVPQKPLPLAARVPKPEAPPLAPLGRRERSQLSRGKKQIDARSDVPTKSRTRPQVDGGHASLCPRERLNPKIKTVARSRRAGSA